MKTEQTNPPVRLKGRGKVARNPREHVARWPSITAEQFARLPGHEKTRVFFETFISRAAQADWHNNFRSAFDAFEGSLAKRDRARRLS